MRIARPPFEPTEKEERRLKEAYDAVLAGRGGKDDAEIVLVDLARFTGFYDVTEAASTEAELRMNEGKRAVFRWLTRYRYLSPAELDSLVAKASKR